MVTPRARAQPDVEKFEKLLAPHQNAEVAYGQTVLSKVGPCPWLCRLRCFTVVPS